MSYIVASVRVAIAALVVVPLTVVGTPACSVDGSCSSAVAAAAADAVEDVSGMSLLQHNGRAASNRAASGAAASTILQTAKSSTSDNSMRHVDAASTVAVVEKSADTAGQGSVPNSSASTLAAPAGQGVLLASLPAGAPSTLVAADGAKGAKIVVNASIGYQRSAECVKSTGGSCLLSGQCDASRGADCVSGFCQCNDYMCGNTGKCVISATEIAKAAASNVPGLEKTVSNLAEQVSGVADTISSSKNWLSSAGAAVSSVYNSIFGDGSCTSMVSTCVFSGCPSSTSLTATCSMGVCSCKQNFCYMHLNGHDTCMVDIKGMLFAK